MKISIDHTPGGVFCGLLWRSDVAALLCIQYPYPFVRVLIPFVSLFTDFCAYVTQTVPEQDHFITANEGNAVAMCAGYHLATGKTGMVYLQVWADVVSLV